MELFWNTLEVAQDVTVHHIFVTPEGMEEAWDVTRALRVEVKSGHIVSVARIYRTEGTGEVDLYEDTSFHPYDRGAPLPAPPEGMEEIPGEEGAALWAAWEEVVGEEVDFEWRP